MARLTRLSVFVVSVRFLNAMRFSGWAVVISEP